MIFNTLAYYFLFLFPSVFAYRLAKREWRPWISTLFGILFFIYFSYTELGGIPAAACVLLFVWEATLSRFYKPGSWVCLFGVVQSLAILAVFKYWNFFTGLVFGGPTSNPFYWAGSFLPLGISFFTFEFIHYAVDRYKNKVEAGKLREYLAFIFFFPTMIAGPIKRYQYFRPSLNIDLTEGPADFNRGITRILAGLAKKFLIADLMTAFTNHLNRGDILVAHRPALALWLLAFGVKIYFDFSGYSDIAIGSARLFGMKVPENFDWPYFRTNIADFWQHWHISLYRWLVDYVYIPLGGSRVKPAKIYRNILITMLLSGLWHGAGVNYIVWGLWHGVLLCVHRLWAKFRATVASPVSGWETGAAWALTFICVQLGWAFFCMDISTATLYFKRLVNG